MFTNLKAIGTAKRTGKIEVIKAIGGYQQADEAQIQDWEERLKEFDRYFEREEVEERGDDLGVYRVFEPLVDNRHMLLFGLPDERMDGLDLHSTESSPGAQHLASDNSKQEVVVEFDDELVPIFSQKAFKKLQTLLKKS
ncbi:hypothetical protein BY996DRAFT_6535097 [Phakopsora pachyrhizi]|nr:hypothetical protein BY996DRAFT_6535097 [Phakopsora pachyrhizi]